MPICPKCRGENPELGAKCPRDGFYYVYEDAVEDAKKDEWIGRLAADKYVILSLISEGGMGAVYRAMQLPVQREVAFKVLRTELEDSDQGKDRFAREARAVSKLTHPNIITMHDFGVDNEGHPYMVMEYAPGKSLADWMMQPGLTLERICHVFRQILSALSEAHDQGVVHRDLKPENLIITRTGNDADFVKLLDFGIARMVHDGATQGLTREGEVFGTPHYMAPEQAQGKKDIGPPADVYALGIMFYELLTGECPFDAPTPLSILYMHINDDLPTLEARGHLNVPDSLRQIVARATAKEPIDRYQTAGEMLGALEHALGNNSGLYSAPAALSSQSLEIPGDASGEAADKATASTLMLQGSEAQRVTGSSNGVPVGEPNADTTFELEAMKARNSKKYVVLAAVLALLLGGGAAVFYASNSGNEADRGAGSAGDDQASAAAETGSDQAADNPAQAQADKPDEAAAQPGDNAGDQPESAQGAPTDGSDEAAQPQPDDAQADDSKAAVATGDEGSQPARNTPDRNTSDSKSTETHTSTHDTPPRDVSAGSTAPTHTKTPDKTASASDKAGASDASDEESKDEQPKKFRPKKFQPKTPTDDTGDDGPKKFEPKKFNH